MVLIWCDKATKKIPKEVRLGSPWISQESHSAVSSKQKIKLDKKFENIKIGIVGSKVRWGCWVSRPARQQIQYLCHQLFCSGSFSIFAIRVLPSHRLWFLSEYWEAGTSKSNRITSEMFQDRTWALGLVEGVVTALNAWKGCLNRLDWKRGTAFWTEFKDGDGRGGWQTCGMQSPEQAYSWTHQFLFSSK